MASENAKLASPALVAGDQEERKLKADDDRQQSEHRGQAVEAGFPVLLCLRRGCQGS